jgi:tRNA (cmo5U34)-methyltransferase
VHPPPLYRGLVTQFHFDPDSYLRTIRAEVDGYDELQAAVADAAAGAPARRILDLGTGTGETAAAVLARHLEAQVVLLDEHPGMLALAEQRLAGQAVEAVVVGDLLAALPDPPFDLVASALAVHHLDRPGKRALFAAVRARLSPGGRFVLGDVVVPDDPADAVAPLTPGIDLPDPVPVLRAGMDAAGFATAVTWARRDLAVVRADAT